MSIVSTFPFKKITELIGYSLFSSHAWLVEVAVV